MEGWHSKFQHMLSTYHASLWKFLEEIRKDQRENEVVILQLTDGGHSRIRHPIPLKHVKTQETIQNTVYQYEQYKDRHEIDEYLVAIGCKTKRYRNETAPADDEEEEQEEQEEL